MSPANVDPQTVLRRLQVARAVAKCIRVAVDYPDDDLDVGDAVGALVALLEDAIAGLDRSGGSS